MKIFSKTKIFILLLYILAFLLRIYGLNWDNNNHLHPDERFLTMLTSDLQLPSSINQYFDTAASPLNPYNYSNYKFFVYGTFPIFLVKFLAVQLHLDDYNNLTLLGRVLSALFDSGNVILLYLVAKKFLKSFYKYLPSLFYAFLILPLQFSHFFTVDTFMTFFLLLTFTFFAYNLFPLAFFAFGLALSCKISALYFSPIILLFLIKKFLSSKNKFSILLLTIYYSLLTLLTFRLFQPYSFIELLIPNPDFINSLKTLANYSNAGIYYPPGVQWLNRLPLLNSFKNNFVWGLGIFFSVPLLILTIKYIFKIKLKFNLISIVSVWVIFLFIIQSIQSVHSIRYIYPVYPFITIILSYLLFKSKINKKLVITIIVLNFLSALAFLNIYSRPHSRVQASEWIHQYIPTDGVLSNEYWDDALPLGYSDYQGEILALFDPDSEEKWERINQSLDRVDYLIMSSNRLWASIPRLPNEYPQASLFYENLFSENLNFTKVKEFNSYPGFPLSFLNSCFYFGPSNFPGIKNPWLTIDRSCLYPGLYFRDDTAEEAFTVYDHPKVLIFLKQK